MQSSRPFSDSETLGLIVACPESIGFTPEFLKGEIPLSPQARTLMDSSDVRSGRSTPIISIPVVPHKAVAEVSRIENL